MIELSNVTRTYRTDHVETTALAGVDLTIGKGEFIAIMGPSGCGKSTLLNILGALDRPTKGRYAFDGTVVSELSESQLSRYRAGNLGFVFQSFNLVDDLSVRENVELGLVYRDARVDRRLAVDTALAKVGVDHRSRHFPHQLSGGQQQRVAIARAIVGEPSLILADEPTGNLDSKNGAQTMSILQDLHAAGATLVMVTHSAEQARLANRVVEMRDGRVVV